MVAPLTLEALWARRREILDLAARYGAERVRVFGSVLHDQIGPGSDVDFLVSFAREGTRALRLLPDGTGRGPAEPRGHRRGRKADR